MARFWIWFEGSGHRIPDRCNRSRLNTALARVKEGQKQLHHYMFLTTVRKRYRPYFMNEGRRLLRARS